MLYISKSIDRDQVMIMTFDSLVEWNRIDLAGMGFKNAVLSFEGTRDIRRNYS